MGTEIVPHAEPTLEGSRPGAAGPIFVQARRVQEEA